MVSELLKKYLWLVQTLIRAGEHGLSLAELGEKWEDRFGSGYARRSFNNHREAIEDVFGIRIECNRSTQRYFIRSAADVADENAGTAWLINTFTVNNMLSLGKERLSGRVSVEDIPSGHRYLTPLLDAMLENREICIGYQKYTSDQPARYTLQPYAVKEAARRWYVIGYCIERGSLRVYGLDRIIGMEVSGRKFIMPAGFDVDTLFATSYGIYLSDAPGRTITFRTTVKEARFLHDLPIHPSQKETARDADSVTFSIFAAPNENLIMEFCRHGDRLEVLSPPDLRSAVSAELSKAAGIYRE